MEQIHIKKLLWSIVLLFSLLVSSRTFTQGLTQTVKGVVFDNESRQPLTGATVVISYNGDSVKVITGARGWFSVGNVPIGRHMVQASHIGYEQALIAGIMVSSGKEVVLNIGLRQSVTEISGVTVRTSLRKERPLNNMATVSARSFTVEETRRYAGGLDDPARLVSAFAGVSTGNISDNAIIVRGNAPKSVSWRLEGVQVPEPHHFAGGNVVGGGMLTMLSSQVLDNSDFFTGAFPSEYGNALAGVFDMNMRRGNTDKYEHTFQLGALGIDIASEGPVSRKNKSSYLFNYRYSTLGLLSDMKILSTDQNFRYQDLSFNLNFPTKKMGTFTLWGTGGIDKSTEPIEKDPSKWETDWDRVSYDWNTYKGAMGLSHKNTLGTKTYIRSTLAFSALQNTIDAQQIDENEILHPDIYVKDHSGKLMFNTYVNHKFSAKHTLKAGVDHNHLFYNSDVNSSIDHRRGTYQNFVNERGDGAESDVYVQSKYNFSPALSLQTGLRAHYFALNKAFSIEPRVGLRWNISYDHALSVGYGKHSQLEELKVYLLHKQTSGAMLQPNKELELAKAHHLVLAYDWHISKNLRLKVEPYFQYLYDVPGITDSSYALINFKQEWAFKNALENNTVGKNVGIDITLERFLQNNFYYLLTASIFDSKYKADDGVWRNTRFNKKYVANALMGKEFFFRDNKRVLGINGRLNITGGERYSPILTEKSLQEKLVIYDEYRAFENQLPASFFADISITYRINHKRYSSIWAIQVKNILGSPTYEGFDYNYITKQVQRSESKSIIPAISYKVEF